MPGLAPRGVATMGIQTFGTFCMQILNFRYANKDFSKHHLFKTSQELQKLPYTSYLESQVYMSVLFVLNHDYYLDHDDQDHLVPDDYHNYDDFGDHDSKKATRQCAHCQRK